MTTDILLFSGDAAVLDDSTWNPGGVRGADKVAQRLLYALATPQGTVPGRPRDGSPFLSLVQSFSSEFDIYVAWAASEPAMYETVRAGELSTEPTSEKLGAARIGAISIVADVATLTIDVRALDGSAPQQPVYFDLPT